MNKGKQIFVWSLNSHMFVECLNMWNILTTHDFWDMYWQVHIGTNVWIMKTNFFYKNFNLKMIKTRSNTYIPEITHHLNEPPPIDLDMIKLYL